MKRVRNEEWKTPSRNQNRNILKLFKPSSLNSQQRDQISEMFYRTKRVIIIINEFVLLARIKKQQNGSTRKKIAALPITTLYASFTSF